MEAQPEILKSARQELTAVVATTGLNAAIRNMKQAIELNERALRTSPSEAVAPEGYVFRLIVLKGTVGRGKIEDDTACSMFGLPMTDFAEFEADLNTPHFWGQRIIVNDCRLVVVGENNEYREVNPHDPAVFISCESEEAKVTYLASHPIAE